MDEDNRLTESIGKKIKLARLGRNLTQEQLAEKTGLSSRYISKLERGSAFGSASTVVGICTALDIDSNFLFNDLVNVETAMSIDGLVDTKFLQSYLKLNTLNKQFIDIIVEQLLKLQNNENLKDA